MALVKFDRGLYRNGNVARGLNYGQIEPNQVWFNRAGMVEAQCALDPDCFSSVQVAPTAVYTVDTSGATPVVTQKIVAQNGAFLQIDKANYTATIPTQADKDAGMPVGINYSTEKLYDDFHKARRNFYLTTQDWLPRIGYVERGMRITTNTVQWSDDAAASGTAKDNTQVTLDLSQCADSTYSYDAFAYIKDFIESGAKTPIYAAVVDGSDGELVILGGLTAGTAGAEGVDIADPTTYIVLAQVVAAYDNADRTCSFMFQILDGGTK